MSEASHGLYRGSIQGSTGLAVGSQSSTRPEAHPVLMLGQEATTQPKARHKPSGAPSQPSAKQKTHPRGGGTPPRGPKEPGDSDRTGDEKQRQEERKTATRQETTREGRGQRKRGKGQSALVCKLDPVKTSKTGRAAVVSARPKLALTRRQYQSVLSRLRALSRKTRAETGGPLLQAGTRV